MPVDTDCQYPPSENLEQDMTVEYQVKAQRHKLKRQFARVEKGHELWSCYNPWKYQWLT